MLIQDYYIDGEFDWDGFYDELAEGIEREVRTISETDITNDGLRIAVKQTVRRSGNIWIDFYFNKDSLVYEDAELKGSMEVNVLVAQDITLQLGLSTADILKQIDAMEWDESRTGFDLNGAIMNVEFESEYTRKLYPVDGTVKVAAIAQVYAYAMQNVISAVYDKTFDMQDKLWQR